MIATMRIDYFKECNGKFVKSKYVKKSFKDLLDMNDWVDGQKMRAYRQCMKIEAYPTAINAAEQE